MSSKKKSTKKTPTKAEITRNAFTDKQWATRIIILKKRGKDVE